MHVLIGGELEVAACS